MQTQNINYNPQAGAANSAQAQLTPAQQQELQARFEQIVNQTISQEDQQLLQSVTEEEIETISFIDNLTCALTGKHLIQVSEQNRSKVMEEVVKIFYNFIFDYAEKNHGIKAKMRLKASQMYGGSVFDKFAELGDIFDEAYDAFVQFLKTVEIA